MVEGGILVGLSQGQDRGFVVESTDKAEAGSTAMQNNNAWLPSQVVDKQSSILHVAGYPDVNCIHQGAHLVNQLVAQAIGP